MHNNLNQISWFAILIEAWFYLKTADTWFFKQSLQICVQQIMQNNASHLKYLAVAKEMFWITFLFCLLIKRWHYLQITEVWHFRSYVTDECSVNYTDSTCHPASVIIIHNVLNWFFFVLWCKMDDVILRLLIVFFLGMLCKLMFCKLENMRWLSNVTWNI